MWNAVWAIARKDIYAVFTNRSLLLIMFATPLMLSTIIGLAFSGLGSGNLSETNLAIVNQDAGAEINGSSLNYGDIFVSVFSPAAETDTGANAATGCRLLTPDPNN